MIAPASNGQGPDLGGCAHPFVLLRTEEGRAWCACRDCGVQFSPAGPPRARESEAAPLPVPVDGAGAVAYLSGRELARRIPYCEGSIRNLMSQGQLKAGIHYLKPGGRVIFRWSAVQAWLAGREPEAE
jgi:hypothetical protein